jgi:hypothetical protein
MAKRYQIVDWETEQKGYAVAPLHESDDSTEADAKLMKLGKNHPRKLALIDVLDRRRIISTAGPQKPKVAGGTGGSY